MATARATGALAAMLVMLAGCAQTIAIPERHIGVSRVPDRPLSASLVLPDGPGPFPAVILLHGCNGIGGGDWYWARRLNDWGYAALVLDSFSARGVTTVCSPQAQHLVTVQDRVADVFSAALYLRTQPKIDGARIGVLGRSHGGHTAAVATQDRYARLYPGLIKAAVDYYGACDAAEMHGNVPLLALAGEADDWGNPALSCQALAAKMKPDQVFEIHTYPGVWHGFDNPDQRTVQVAGHTLAYDAGAATDSIERVHVFLDTWLRQKPATG